MPTLFIRLATLCKNLEATPKRKEKTRLISETLQQFEPDEISPTVLMLAGSIFPENDDRTLDVGWGTLKPILNKKGQTTLFQTPLTISDVHLTFNKIAKTTGTGSKKIKQNLLEGLLNRMDPEEADYFIRMIFGEMRIGVNEGVLLAGIAETSGSPPKLVRRAHMMTGNLGTIAYTAITLGESGLKKVEMKLFVPLKSMLAANSTSFEEILKEHGGETAFEYKYDGARVQIHKQGEEIRVYSRRLADVTESLPDIVNIIREHVRLDSVILEGEAVATGKQGKPLPFQDLMRRFRRVHDVEETTVKIPLKLYFFDILYSNGELHIDKPYKIRWKLLEKIANRDLLAQRIITNNPDIAKKMQQAALEAGHEGLMAKRLSSQYRPGTRGKNWIKIKPSESLDLVIVAADWGYGRRTGWLSNYHLATRDGNDYLVIGKTFKGLTDKEFTWITKKLQEYKIRETPGTVYVKPELVVEITYNEIQKSKNYRSGYALRFARITRIREDRKPENINTINDIKNIYENQFQYKDKLKN